MTATVKHIEITDWKRRMADRDRERDRKARTQRVSQWLGVALMVLLVVIAAAVVWASLRNGQATEITLADLLAGFSIAMLGTLAIRAWLRRRDAKR